MRLNDCHNFHDFRRLAQQRLPGPIFNYIDGGADDEVTMRRNSAAFETCDLVPSVLRGVSDVDLSTTVMGQKIDLPVSLQGITIKDFGNTVTLNVSAGALEPLVTLLNTCVASAALRPGP